MQHHQVYTQLNKYLKNYELVFVQYLKTKKCKYKIHVHNYYKCKYYTKNYFFFIYIRCDCDYVRLVHYEILIYITKILYVLGKFGNLSCRIDNAGLISCF